MAKKSTAIAKQKLQAAQLPAYLQDVQSTGLEDAVHHIQPSRLKIVQKMTKPPLIEKYNPGDVVLMPQEMLLAEMPYDGAKALGNGEPFTFVPLLFYPEWLTTNKHGVDPFIVGRSTDRNSELAHKARTASLRKEIIDGKEVRHIEVLNFLLKLDHEEFGAMPAVISFAKGEWRRGSNFLTMMKLRKAPIWSMRFQGSVSERSNDEGSWYGFDVNNPSDEGTSFITEEEMPAYQAAHDELVAAREENRIVVDHEDGENAAPAESSEF